MRKKNVALLLAFVLIALCPACNVEIKDVGKDDDSRLFETIKEKGEDIGIVFESWSTSLFDCFSPDAIIYVGFWIIVFFCITSLLLFFKELVWWIKAGKKNLSSLKNLLPNLASWVFFSGVAIYYLGYAYGGTSENLITLGLRSLLSSFEMFLSKSNLIGIANNCKNNSIYMFFFAFFHAFAVMISMIFAVTCFGKRIKDWIRGIIWNCSFSKPVMHVFWGLNERSILLAKDIYGKTNGSERIVFVDFPQNEDEGKDGQSFSGILGLLSYKINVARQIAGIKYLLLRSSMRPSLVDADSKNFLGNMNIRILGRFMKKASKVNFFVLTNDETANLRASLIMLNSEIGTQISCLYCSAKKTRVTGIQEECQEGRLRLIDDSKEAVMEFAMRKNDKGECMAHPINFVHVNHQFGYVDSQEPFTSLLVGFGATGQNAFRFLYEFSAFPDSKGKKAPVRFLICDNQINAIKGEIYREIPVLSELEEKGEIEFCSCNAGTKMFYDKLCNIIDQLNYVMIAVGDDERNLQIAVKLYEYALQYRKNGFRNFKIFVRLYDSGNAYIFEKTIDAYSNYNAPAIEYFGSPKSLYTKKWIIDNEEEIKAELFYKSYCSVAKTECLSGKQRKTEEVNKEETKLLGLRRHYRMSMQDKANCKHCYTKEILLGLRGRADVFKLPVWPIKLNGEISEDVREWYIRLLNVSICEHLRWNASHIMMGYTKLPLHEADSLHISCKEKTKQHLCLMEWDKLYELSDKIDYQEYDYMVVLTTINLYYGNEGR